MAAAAWRRGRCSSLGTVASVRRHCDGRGARPAVWAGRHVRRGRRRLLRALLPAPAARARSSPISPCSPRTGIAATRAIRGRSTRSSARRPPGARRLDRRAGARRARSRPASSTCVAGTRDYYRLIARAKYFVNNVNFPNDFVKREGTIHVQTHHGTPLKTMGLDLRSAYFASSRMNFERLLSARGAVGLQRHLERLLDGDLEARLPRAVRDARGRLSAQRRARERDRGGRRRDQGRAGDRARDSARCSSRPTHREYRPEYVPTRRPRATGCGELGPELRHHEPRCTTSTTTSLCPRAGARSARILDVTRHPSIEELCLAADVLVTDYSSIMFDYAVLDRPIVIHAPDWDEYRAKRGTYFDLLAEPPGIVTRTDDELVAAFRSGAVGGERGSRAAGGLSDALLRRSTTATRPSGSSVGSGCPRGRRPDALWRQVGPGPGSEA